MLALSTFFSGLAGKLAIALGVLLVFAALIIGIEYYRSAYETANTKLQQAMSDNASITKQAQADVAALQAANTEALARSQVTTSIRSKIAAAPATKACATSPAIAAVLQGLKASKP